ncbi:MAG: FecR domain-containing protein [Alphaproteobacteria bacterium]
MRVRILAAACLIGLSAVASSALAAGAADEWIARVKRVSGEAYVERDGARAPLAVGDRLAASAVVVTGQASGAGLTFRDNTRAAIGQNGRLVLADYAFEPGRTSSDARLEAGLEQGAAAFVSGRVTERRQGAMQVRTPAALLGVRGTAFLAVTGQPLDR